MSTVKLALNVTFFLRYHRPSVVCLSVTFVVEIFGNVSTPFGNVAIRPFGKNFTEIVAGNPSVRGVKHKRGSRI